MNKPKLSTSIALSIIGITPGLTAEVLNTKIRANTTRCTAKSMTGRQRTAAKGSTLSNGYTDKFKEHNEMIDRKRQEKLAKRQGK